MNRYQKRTKPPADNDAPGADYPIAMKRPDTCQLFQKLKSRSTNKHGLISESRGDSN
jgi:hypothetical protein